MTAALGLAIALGLTVTVPALGDDETPSPTPEATDTTDATETTEPTDGTDATETAEATESPEATATAEETEEPLPEIEPSLDLAGIEVEGEPGEKPTVTVPFPWAINRSQNKVLDKGDGALVLPGDIVRVHYIGVDGRTGEVFDNSYDSGEPIAFSLTGVVTGFAKGLTGQRVGARILMAMPSDDAYGDYGNGDTISAGDSLVFVAEIIDASRHSVSGTAADTPAGLPDVSGDLKPAVTLPVAAEQPAELQVATVIAGDGPAVEEAGYVQVNYVEYAWSGDTLTFIRQTYGTGSGPIYSYLGGTTVPAWTSGLVGVTQGSRVLIVSPPEQAYPTGDAKLGISAGDYSVWVVDVLFAG
jgi:peptidylprolyl isomerase